jgi:3D-(3,5/4)-trihydroxycyclohexane-1,2-dione acylhydrolase (decyclizing)
MITGAATATTNRLPVLLLPSDTFANRRQGPVLQQLEHASQADVSVNDAFRPVSRYFDRITRPEQLLTALPDAMRVLLDPAETGAVTISLHQDVQGEAAIYPAGFFADRIWHVERRPPAPGEIARAAEVIQGAERPLIVAGGGCRYSAAEDELRSFAERHGIPVAETSAGKGSLTDSPWLIGGIGVNGTRAATATAADADVVICIGTRLSDFTTGSQSLFQDDAVRFVGVNVNAADAHKLGAAPVVADAREALAALSEALAGWSTAAGYAAQTRGRVETWRRDLATDVEAAPAEPMHQGRVLTTINESAAAGDWVVAAAGWQPGDLLKLWDVRAGTFTHIEFAYSCMGHEIPAALGIRMHEGDGPEVVVVIGDGTFLMNPTELVTAVQERLKLTVVVLDNGGYQSINRLALGSTGRTAGNEFRTRGRDGRLPDGDAVAVDYVATARGLGCDATLAATPDALRGALDAARSRESTTVIVCPTQSDGSLLASGAFWDLGVPEVSTDADTRALTADHLERRGAQRHH